MLNDNQERTLTETVNVGIHLLGEGILSKCNVHAIIAVSDKSAFYHVHCVVDRLTQ